MNPLLKKLLPGLLPLIVFILADELLGTEVGIIVALVFGAIQLVYIRIVRKEWDRFVLLDTALLIALGAVSLLLENEQLFLWKPVLMDVLLIGFLLFSLLSRHQILLSMSRRYIGDVDMNREQQRMMNIHLIAFLVISFIHAGLTIYAIYFLSHEAWFFIGGTLLYILAGAWMLVFFLYAKIKQKRAQVEYVPVVDEEGKILERVSRKSVHDGSNKLHPVVHLHVIREDGAFLLQLRPMNKTVQPGKWDTSVGGHVSWGESIEKAMARESAEEIGLKRSKPGFAGKYIWKSEIETELVFMFIYRATGNERFTHRSEVADLRWWSHDEIKRNLRKNVFTPNFELEFEAITVKKKSTR